MGRGAARRAGKKPATTPMAIAIRETITTRARATSSSRTARHHPGSGDAQDDSATHHGAQSRVRGKTECRRPGGTDRQAHRSPGCAR
jgi:hypothetical protein